MSRLAEYDEPPANGAPMQLADMGARVIKVERLVETPGRVLVSYNQCRYHRVDRDTIQYSATFEEPSICTQPWTTFVPMKWDAEMDRKEFWEYGCHEGEKASTHLDDSVKESAAHCGEAAWARAHAGPASSIPVRRRYTCFSSGVAL